MCCFSIYALLLVSVSSRKYLKGHKEKISELTPVVKKNARFEVFTVVQNQVVLWVVMPCSHNPEDLNFKLKMVHCIKIKLATLPY